MHITVLFLVCVVALGSVVYGSDTSDIFQAVALDNAASIAQIASAGPASVLNKKGPGGQTPLMNAVLSGKKNAVEALLLAGADVSIPEQDGYTPLHGAGFQGRADIAQLLIDHGVPASSQHKDGFLPFHRACWGKELRHTDTVEVFLDAGVAPDTPALNSQTCMEMTKNDATKKLLKRYIKNASKGTEL